MEVKRKPEHGYASSSSSPPSPLPVSTGPGNQKYLFTPSPSLSPPFSTHSSTELLPLFRPTLSSSRVPSTFFLDRRELRYSDSDASCLRNLLEWFIERCCNICTKSTKNLLSNEQHESNIMTRRDARAAGL